EGLTAGPGFFSGSDAQIWTKNLIFQDGARALAAATWLPAVEVLTLRSNAVGAAGAMALASVAAPGPIDLDLRDNEIDERGAAALAAAGWPRLERIGLSGNLLYGDRDPPGRDAPYFASGRPLEADEIAERYFPGHVEVY
ncbi:MAG TPA: hypothetical protein VML75_04770, partial [Kofleriaceae bacterium]|nr:hypothetical protein [Kofleriaceae bacterium]